MTPDFEEVRCDECGKVIGWTRSSQPRGHIVCEECKNKEEGEAGESK